MSGRQSGKKQLSLVMSFLKHESIELRSFPSSEEKLGMPLLHFLRALGVFPFPLFKPKLESFSLILFCLLWRSDECFGLLFSSDYGLHKGTWSPQPFQIQGHCHLWCSACSKCCCLPFSSFTGLIIEFSRR